MNKCIGIKDTAIKVFISLFLIFIFGSVDSPAADKVKTAQKEPIVIDFNDVVTRDDTPKDLSSMPPLKVAVAAMISPKFTYKYYLDLLNLIGRRMGREIVFIQKKTYSEVNEMIRQRALDFAFVCSGPYVSGSRSFGLEIIAVPVCNGEKVYYSYFIASQKSGIESMNDLRGKIFAFTDPMSNTGCQVPTYYLAKQNETPGHFFSKTFFTHSHDNSIRAVKSGIADGAAVDSLIFEFIKAESPDMTKSVKVIEKSPPYGIPPVVVHPMVDSETKEKLRSLFLTIHENPEGKKYLNNLHIDRFERGDDSYYKSVRELQDFLIKSSMPETE